jgi:predicted nucleotidyltransferase
MIYNIYGNNVEVILMPDISSINIGRNVGYEIKEIKVSDDIKGISATNIRNSIKNNNLKWQDNVDKNNYNIIMIN